MLVNVDLVFHWGHCTAMHRQPPQVP
jgi:hypothetical protein